MRLVTDFSRHNAYVYVIFVEKLHVVLLSVSLLDLNSISLTPRLLSPFYF